MATPQQQKKMPEPTRFSNRIKDEDGHYDLDGVSQDDDAEVVVASQRPVPKEHSTLAKIAAHLKKRRHFFPR